MLVRPGDKVRYAGFECVVIATFEMCGETFARPYAEVATVEGDRDWVVLQCELTAWPSSGSVGLSAQDKG